MRLFVSKQHTKEALKKLAVVAISTLPSSKLPAEK